MLGDVVLGSAAPGIKGVGVLCLDSNNSTAHDDAGNDYV